MQAAQSPRLVLSNITYLASIEGGPTAAARGDVVIERGIVTTVRDPYTCAVETSEVRIDGGDMIALPGLVNAAADTSAASRRGILLSLNPSAALSGLSDMHRAATARDEEARTARAAAELLAGGTTCVVDVVRAGPERLDRTDARLAAYARAGIRAEVAVEVDSQLLADPTAVDRLRASFRTVPGHAPVRPALALAVRGAADIDVARAAVDELGVHGAQLHLFAAETRTPVPLDERATALIHLAERLRPSAGGVAASGLPVSTPATAARLAEAGLAVVLNPETDMLLGRSPPDGRMLAAAGVDVRLGTGVVSNGSLAMLPVLRLATMAARPAIQDVSAWLTNADAFRFATKTTRGVERAITPGAPADLVLYDRTTSVWTPLNNVVDQFVSAETGRNALVTIVAGRVVYDKRPRAEAA